MRSQRVAACHIGQRVHLSVELSALEIIRPHARNFTAVGGKIRQKIKARARRKACHVEPFARLQLFDCLLRRQNGYIDKTALVLLFKSGAPPFQPAGSAAHAPLEALNVPQFQNSLEPGSRNEQIGTGQIGQHDKGRGKHKRAQQNDGNCLCPLFFVHNEFYERRITEITFLTRLKVCENKKSVPFARDAANIKFYSNRVETDM